MSAPSNPTPPIPPTSQQPQQSSPQQAAPPPPGGPLPKSSVDPTGQWAKFLGPTATAKDVENFIHGLLKTFNVLIQQAQRAAKRAADEMKKSIEGK